MYKKFSIDSIRILPMNMSLEFDGYSYKEIQKEYFMKDLIDKNGEYKYREHGMIIYGETLVLFQFSNMIIASAILEDVVKIKDDIYKGKYLFNPKSIAVFNYITSDEIKNIFNIKKLSQSKQKLDISKIDELFSILESKEIKFVKDLDINFDELFYNENSYVEYEDKIEKLVSNQENKYNQFKRRQRYKKIALERANFNCEISNLHKSFISRTTGKNYVEAHHLIPLSYQDNFIYSLDIPSNIVSLCPNCHKFLHHADIEDKKEILIELLINRKKRLKKCGITIKNSELVMMYT